jgi:hypothetical protein
VSGQYQGRLEKTFPQPGEDPDPKCDKSTGSRRDQTVIGMTILWGMTRQGEDYQSGQVLDPENGKIYRAKMKLEDGGKTLHVRFHRHFFIRSDASLDEGGMSLG